MASPSKRNPRHKNSAEVAEFFGVRAPTIREWVANNRCPYVSRGGKGIEWVFDIRAVHEWRLAYMVRQATGDADNQSSLARRKLAATTSIKEAVAERAMRSVVPVDWFVEAQEEVFEIVRAELSKIAPAAAERVASEQGMVQCRNILDEAVNDARSAIVATAQKIAMGS